MRILALRRLVLTLELRRELMWLEVLPCVPRASSDNSAKSSDWPDFSSAVARINKTQKLIVFFLFNKKNKQSE